MKRPIVGSILCVLTAAVSFAADMDFYAQGAQVAAEVRDSIAQAQQERKVAETPWWFKKFIPIRISRSPDHSFELEGGATGMMETMKIRLERDFESGDFGKFFYSSGLELSMKIKFSQERPMTPQELADLKLALSNLPKFPHQKKDMALYREFISALPDAGVVNLGRLPEAGKAMDGKTFKLKPGQALRWYTLENSAQGTAGKEAKPADAAAVNARPLGTGERPGGRTVEHSVKVADKAKPGDAIQVDVRGNEEVAQDPSWTFSFNIVVIE